MQSSPPLQPPPTRTLLTHLTSAHADMFPVASGSLVLQNGSSDIRVRDAPEENDVGTASSFQGKGGLIRAVLGGWMITLASEEDAYGVHVDTANETVEHLITAVRGPLRYVAITPASLLFRPKTLLEEPLQGSAPVDVEADVDLVTYLVPRILRALASITAALLTSDAPDIEFDTPASRLWTSRTTAVGLLEDFLVTIISGLAQSCVNIEWKGDDMKAQGGVARARQVVSDLVAMLQDLAMVSPSPSTPFAFAFTPVTTHRVLNEAGETWPYSLSIQILGALHSRALYLTTLRVLLRITQQSLVLADYSQVVIDLIVTSWPRTKFASSDKGKERAGTPVTFDNVMLSTLGLVVQGLQGGLHTAPILLGKLAICVCRFLQQHLLSTATDEYESTLSRLVSTRLALIFSHIKTTLNRTDVSHFDLRQVLAQLVVEHGERLVEYMCTCEGSTAELRVAVLFILTSPATSPSSLTTDNNTASLSPTLIEVLPSAALIALGQMTLTSTPTALPFEVPASLAAVNDRARSAWRCLLQDYKVLANPEPELRGAKRKRQDSRDEVEMSQTQSGKKKPVPWRPIMEQVLLEGLQGIEDDLGEAALEREGLDSLIGRLIPSILGRPGQQMKQIMQVIGLTGCGRDGTLSLHSVTLDGQLHSSKFCSVCDELIGLSSPASVPRRAASGRIFGRKPLDALKSIASTILADDVDPTIQLCYWQAVRRVLNHTKPDVSALNFEAGKSNWIDFIFKTMGHSRRSYRLATGDVLLSIVDAHQEYDQSSTAYIAPLFQRFDFLLESSAAVMETTLKTVGRLTRLAYPQGLLECQCLATLMARFGHRNFFIKSLTRCEMDEIAAAREIKPYALVQPHFGTICPILVNSPATLAAALDCFQQPRESLLYHTREYTLPKLILDDNEQVIQQIAEAGDMDVPMMFCDSNTAGSVLAYLLMQSDEERTKGLNVFTREIGKSKPPITLRRLLLSIKVNLDFRLALFLGDEDSTIQLQAQRAFLNVERIKNPAVAEIDLGAVLKLSIVGILASMNQGLKESTAHRPLHYKQQIVRGLSAVIERVGPAIAGYSPQILTTLQSALEIPGLRFTALHAFFSFFSTLKFNEIGPFIGATSATFVRMWSALDYKERVEAAKTIDYIILHTADNLSQHVQDIADLSECPELKKANLKLCQIRKHWKLTKRCGYLITRIGSENDVVCLQAIKELKVLMAASTKELQSYSAGDSFDRSLGRLVKVLCTIAAKDSAEHEEARNLAYECIGILGAIDPDRFEMPEEDSPLVVLRNFTDHTESVEFALHLIQDLLIGAYRSTNDTGHQELLAFAIQELLTFCGFTSDLLPSATAKPVSSTTRMRWNKLPKTVHETCGPLLGSSFHAHLKPILPAQYPIYPSTASYRDWIRFWTDDLVGKLSGQHVKQIFSAFPPMLRADITIARRLLPHLILHTVISGTDEDRKNVKNEMEKVLTDQVDPKHQFSESSRLLSAQAVFDLMDHLSLWITKFRQAKQQYRALQRKSKDSRSRPPVADPEGDMELIHVESILQDIPQDLVAQAALTCKAYSRSLLNFENRIVAQRATKDDSQLQEYFERLHECYAYLDEPDGMEGISTRIVSPTVWHQIREHETTGRWTSAQSCWEVKLQQSPEDPACHIGLLRCLRNLGHYDSMRTHIIGLLHSGHSNSDWNRILAPFNIEASLIVSDWTAVETALRITGIGGPEAAFGRVITAMRQGTPQQLNKAFYDARQQLGAPIVAAGKESYRNVYDSVVHLHILHELQAVSSLQDSATPEFTKTLLARLESTSPTFRAREPILNMQRTVLSLGKTPSARDQIGGLWLETSKIARKAGYFQTAYSAILQADNFHAPFAFLQRAKLLKDSESHLQRAIQEIDNALRPLIPATFSLNPGVKPSLVTMGRPSVIAKASLRRARWMHQAGNLDRNGIVAKYTEGAKLCPDWESPLYYLGHYWDSLWKAIESRLLEKGSKDAKDAQNRNADGLTFQSQTCKLYSAALCHGTKYIYQALPRMLTIWLELGEKPELLKLLRAKKKNPAPALDGAAYELYSHFHSINKMMERNIKKLPVYQWLTVLPQLVSRILHVNDALYETLERILLRVLSCYPHHGFWAMASTAKSTTARRARRCSKIFTRAQDAHAQAPQVPINITALINEGIQLVDSLLELCNYTVGPKENSLSLHRQFPQLFRLAPTQLIIPIQGSLNVALPADTSSTLTHKPFPDKMAVFHSFADEIDIMSSLQKPKKITVNADNGVTYSFLCKPKDDLRKDARLMEFNSMIIKLLKKDSESRKRGLLIRTYAVVPLNEECGLIEWVPNVVVLRAILNQSYANRGITPWTPEIKHIYDTIRDDLDLAGERFDREILSRYPSVFHEWFLETFPEPSAWLRARLAYSRTAAVMSMVGFVLGLGDRHCENILLEANTGDTIHVDFNCLFDKARTFDVGEKVPFRLTHNIIDGMGVTGVEGVFRRSSEITLRILRDNKESLMSVLETFVHDPLVEWNTRRRSKEPPDADQVAKAIHDEARRNLEPISLKLRGLQVTSDPLSRGEKEAEVGEQVERLIREARSSKHLAQMYCGWSAFF